MCLPCGDGRRPRPPASLFRFIGAWRAAACVLIAAFALLLAVGTAQAQTSVTLVSNTGQSGNQRSAFSIDRAQPFTTGSNAAGYMLTSVTFNAIGAGATIDLSLTQMRIESSSADNKPGGSLGALTLSHSGSTVTGTTTGIDLDPDTTYFVVLESTDEDFFYRRTTSNNEDAGAAAGWSIGDGSLFDSDTTLDWNSTSATSWKIAIHGYANSPAISSVAIVSKPDIDANEDGTKETYGAGQKIAVDVTWGEDVAWDTSATGAGIQVQLGIGSNTRPAELVTGGKSSGTAPHAAIHVHGAGLTALASRARNVSHGQDAPDIGEGDSAPDYHHPSLNLIDKTNDH